MKNFVSKKGHFYKELSKDSYNRNKLMVKEWDDNNLIRHTKKTFTISKFSNPKILKIQRM